MRAWMLLVLLAACGYPKTGPPPGPLTAAAIEAARTRFPSATAASLEAGRQLYLTRCSDCHAHPAIAAYTDVQWQRIMPRMASKAGLSESEQQQVLEFVLAARAPTSAAGRGAGTASPSSSHSGTAAWHPRPTATAR